MLNNDKANSYSTYEIAYIVICIIICCICWLGSRYLASTRLKQIEQRLSKIEQDVKDAHWQAMWAQTLLDNNMQSIGKELRHINKEPDIPLWGWEQPTIDNN